MSRFRSEPGRPVAVVGIPQTGVAAWIVRTPVVRSGSIPLDDETDPGGNDLQARVQSCRQHLSQVVELKAAPLWILSSFTLVTWMQSIPVGIRSIAELASVASQRARFLYGQPPCGSGWVTRGDWRTQVDFLCQAIPQTALDALGQDRAASLLSLALTRLQQLPAPGRDVRWYAITGPGEWHMVATRGGHPLSIRSGRLDTTPAQALPQQIRSLWQREQLITGLSSPQLTWWDCEAHTSMPVSAPDIDHVRIVGEKLPDDTLAHPTDTATRMALAAWSLCNMEPA